MFEVGLKMNLNFLYIFNDIKNIVLLLIYFMMVGCNYKSYEICSDYSSCQIITSVDEEKYSFNEQKIIKKIDFLNLESKDTCFIPSDEEYKRYIFTRVLYESPNDSKTKVIGYRYIYALTGYGMQYAGCEGGELYQLIIYIQGKKYVLRNENQKTYQKILSKLKSQKDVEIFLKYKNAIIDNSYCRWYGSDKYWQ